MPDHDDFESTAAARLYGDSMLGQSFACYRISKLRQLPDFDRAPMQTDICNFCVSSFPPFNLPSYLT